MNMITMAALISRGYNPKHVGTWYLASAIEHTARTRRPMAMTKELYPQVAKEHGTTAVAVERGMRTAIRNAEPGHTNAEVVRRMAAEWAAHED